MKEEMRIETRNLVLRPLCEWDGDRLVQLLNDYEVSRWLTVVPYPYTRAHFDAFLAHLKATSDLDGLAITRDDDLLGVIGLTATLGYWLGREYQGAGVVSEAAKALVSWGFENLELESIESGYFQGNVPSRAILHKLGFRETGLVRPTRSQAQKVNMPMVMVELHRQDWIERADVP